MRSNIAERDVQTHGVGEVSNFTIKATGKAFKVLIDGLYSDKIRAVIREIWSNAYDAHAMAGNLDTPFECQLPTQFDPVFRVRDYGVGMDHETIMNLYTRVFESSKEDTNAQVGKLGLGSKSPFAYTDTFTVTAFDGKERRVYSAFIGKAYVPQIAVMAKVPCREPRGIEIQFPVNAADVAAFQEAARITVRGFETPPKVTGARFEVKPLETVMTGNGWRLVKNDGVYGLKAHAKQGCVVYPLDPNALDHITDFERAILSSPFFIDFAIGDLEISASRESLGYDEPTKANIRNRLSQIADEIVSIYQAEIDGAPNMWQACKRFKKLLASNMNRGVIEVLKARTTYKGKPLKPNQDLGDFLRPAFDRALENGGLRAMKIGVYDLDRACLTYGRRPSLKFEPTVYTQVEAGETIVLFDDSDKPASLPQARIRHWWTQLLREDRHPVLWVKAKADSMIIKRLIALMGRPSVINLADLEKPPVEAGAYQRRPTKVKRHDRGSWVETEIDENDDIVYVELNKRDTVGHNGNATSPAIVQRAVTLLIELGYLKAGQEVYGIPQTHKKKIAGNDHWVCLWDLARKAVEEKYDASRAGTARSFARKMLDVSSRASTFMRDLVQWDAFKGFDDANSAASVLLSRWEKVVEKAQMGKELDTALSLHTLLGGVEPTVRNISFDGSEKLFAIHYPMAMAVLDGHSYVNFERRKLIIDYVNLIDASHKFRQGEATETAEAA